MPFLKLEISSNLRSDDLSERLLLPAVDAISKAFDVPPAKVKVQLYTPDTFFVGKPGAYDGFAFLSLGCFADRSAQSKQAVSEALLQLLRNYFENSPHRVKLAAYITALERACTCVWPVEGE